MDDLFEGERLELRSWGEFIQIIDVGLEVLPVVELERLARDVWLESVEGVWEWSESEHSSKMRNYDTKSISKSRKRPNEEKNKLTKRV